MFKCCFVISFRFPPVQVSYIEIFWKPFISTFLTRTYCIAHISNTSRSLNIWEKTEIWDSQAFLNVFAETWSTGLAGFGHITTPWRQDDYLFCDGCCTAFWLERFRFLCDSFYSIEHRRYRWKSETPQSLGLSPPSRSRTVPCLVTLFFWQSADDSEGYQCASIFSRACI